MTNKLLVATLAAAVGLLLGCGGSSDQPFADGEIRVVGDQNIFSPADSYRRQGQDDLAREEALAQCMRLQGFEYQSTDWKTPESEVFDDAYREDASDAQFAERYGFGLATLEALSQQHVLANFDQYQENSHRVTLNEANLSAEELQAFERALYGTEDEPGCEGEAYAGAGVATDLYIDLIDEVNAAKLSFTLDGRTIDFYSDWSRCMGERGHIATSPLELQMRYERAFLEIMSSSDADGEEPESSASSGPGEPDQRLVLAAEDERQSAIDTVTCGGTVVDLLPVELETVWEFYADDIG